MTAEKTEQQPFCSRKNVDEKRNGDKIILDLCGGTGAWSAPYATNGYDVRVITSPDYDVIRWRECTELCELTANNRVHGILAAPPCTMFSIARNDTTAKMKRDLREGFKIVHSCLEIIWECLYSPFRISQNSLKFWALENPNGYLKRFLGKPSLDFHPYMYGDPHTKRTLVWGMFNQPKKNIVKPREFEHPTTKGAHDYVKCVEHFADLRKIPSEYISKTSFSKRAVLRSMTPPHFAQAFFEANP